MRFRLKPHPKRVCWALTGRSFGFSTAPLVKVPLEGAQPTQILIMPDLVVMVIAPEMTPSRPPKRGLPQELQWLVKGLQRPLAGP